MCGRKNYSFEANSEDEVQAVHSLLQKEIKAKFGGGYKIISISLGGNSKDKKELTSSLKSLDNVKNLSIKIEGGDYTYKDDFKKWIHSFNMDNLQIIEYKTLSRIYSFIPELESKLYICLENYEDIVLKEIYSLIENEYIKKEKEIFKGSSENQNKWKVGITKEQYKSFSIYRKKIEKKLKIKLDNKKEENKEENKEDNKEEKKEDNKEKKIVKDVICGEIPDGFVICGWILKTNCNSKAYDVVGNWERKKEIQIIGEEFFKFKVDLTIDNDLEIEEVEIDWILEIFCIHSDYLLKYSKKDIIKNMNQHYFINCDCGQKENESCYYISKPNNNNKVINFNNNSNNNNNNNKNNSNISKTGNLFGNQSETSKKKGFGNLFS